MKDFHQAVRPPAPSFGESNVKSRIKNVLHYKKPAFWVILIAVIAVVAVSIGLIANPKTDNSKPITLPVVSLENTKAEFITSLDDWDALNYDKRLSENCYNFFYNLLSGKSEIEEYNSVVIQDYKISFASTSEDTLNYLNFDFTVESSSLDALPPGNYHKIVADIVDCYLWDSLDAPDSDFLGDFKGIEEVEMVANWISSIYVWDCPKFGTVKNENINVNYLIKQYGKNQELLVDDFIRLSKEKFGIETVDLTEYDGLIIDKDGIKYITPGGIGGSYEYLVTDYSIEGDIATVTVQHYADCNRLIPSHLVAYHIKKDGIWLGYDILTQSKHEPYHLHKLYS